jgi:twitching motility protein PilT
LRHVDGAPYRVHAWRHASGIRVAIRLLQEGVPTFETLGLPSSVIAFTQLHSGLVLFAGPTGSGKTTALAAILDHLNQTSERVIVTVEDPIEYLHVSRRSMVTQCEVGRDVADYREALHGFLRADPDVIFIGELRDRVTMEAALGVAETGHLVFATLHTSDAAQTIDRLVDAFEPHAHAQVRSQLATTLAGIVALRLVTRNGRRGRCAAAEVLIATDAVRALIREGKSHQLRNAIVTGRQVGMQTLESHLTELVMRGEVELSTARAATSRPAEIRISDGGLA